MLEEYFNKFRKNIIGSQIEFDTPYGKKKILYADWTASGRLYDPIEIHLKEKIFPFVGNTHTGTTLTGSIMTTAYHIALKHIKKHVHANEDDIIISSNSGMTGVINKFQRILGLKIHEKFLPFIPLEQEDKPVVFVTHMEHHSNHTTWLETIAEVEVIKPTREGFVDLNDLEQLLKKHHDRKVKIAAVTACSNVTGISTPFHHIASIMHQHHGFCFVDFACSAPYVNINMHPDDPEERLDAIYFSPHKFLGGPGTSGILIFHRTLYHNRIPDTPGGGTVDWTNPWGGHKYVDDIETREDGGTPAFLQTIKAALCINLKQEMGTRYMLEREKELLDILWDGLSDIKGLHIMAEHIKERLGIISFYVDDLHYNLIVRMLNDRFGIQTRGGCSCAGTYGHYLLHVDPRQSRDITSKIDTGDLSEKPGWVRVSIHPVMTDDDIRFLVSSIQSIVENHQEWAKEYTYDRHLNEFRHIRDKALEKEMAREWFL